MNNELCATCAIRHNLLIATEPHVNLTPRYETPRCVVLLVKFLFEMQCINDDNTIDMMFRSTFVSSFVLLDWPCSRQMYEPNGQIQYENTSVFFFPSVQYNTKMKMKK